MTAASSSICFKIVLLGEGRVGKTSMCLQVSFNRQRLCEVKREDSRAQARRSRSAYTSPSPQYVE